MSLDAPIGEAVDGRGHRIAVVASRYNGEFVESLLRRLQGVLSTAGVAEDDIEVLRVPGSLELPYAVNELARSKRFHCVVALGVVIAGQTDHHHVVGTNASRALQDIAVSARVPVINGVVVVSDRGQAEARCGDEIDRGGEFGRAALAMAHVSKKLRSGVQP